VNSLQKNPIMKYFVKILCFSTLAITVSHQQVDVHDGVIISSKHRHQDEKMYLINKVTFLSESILVNVER